MLNNEDIEFIKNLSCEMKTQDNRWTVQPYGLVIGKKERRIGDYNNCEYSAIHWNESDYDSFEELLEAMKIYYLEDEESHEVIDFINDNCTDIDDLHYYENEILSAIYESFKVYGYTIENTFDLDKPYIGNFFLTEKSAKQYIENNKHNLGETAFTHGIHLYRNPEMEKLYEIIHKLADHYG